MPIHDAYGRITPYEMVVPTAEFAESWFTRVRDEAREREADTTDPEAFPLLSEVGALLREIRPEGDDPRLLLQYGNLLYHSYHFWWGGRPYFLADTGVVRFLTENGPEEGSWEPALPGGAGYVQLPQHLVWTPGEEGSPPESLDGFFWSAPEGGELSLLLAMGIRKERPGLSVVPLPPLPLESAAPWASVAARPDGRDFHSSLPGAELEGLYAVEAGAEALKLAMRVFWFMDTVPACVAEEERAQPPEWDGALQSGAPGEAEEGDAGAELPAGPVPTALAYRRIVLGDA